MYITSGANSSDRPLAGSCPGPDREKFPDRVQQVELEKPFAPSKRDLTPTLKKAKIPKWLVRFLAVFAIVGLLTTIWSLASPLLSVPDEPAHTIKAASVVRGQLKGESGTTQGERNQVLVPAYIAATDGSPSCFAFKPLVSAGCQPEIGSDTSLVPGYTSAGNYNPLYYAVAGLPSLFMSGETALYAMRILSGLLSAFFIALAMTSLAGLRRGGVPLFIASFSVTPMVLFLSGSVNPNSLEVAASLSVFCALSLCWDKVASHGNWKVPLAVAAVSAVVLANTRAASLLWLALAVVASVMLFGFRPLLAVLRQRYLWGMVGIVAVGCGISLLWLRYANSLQSLVGEGFNAPPIHIVSIMLDRTFDFAAGYVSYLGWLDTLGPTGVLAVWAALIIGALVVALAGADRQGRLTVVFLLSSLLVLPPLLQIPLAKDVGLIWQGRYILALVAVLIAACGVAVRNFQVGLNAGDRQSLASAGRRAGILLLGAMVFAHLYSFVYGLRRYVIGIQDQSNWSDMVDAPQWQPPFGWIALSVAYLLVLIAGAWLIQRFVAPRIPASVPSSFGTYSTSRSDDADPDTPAATNSNTTGGSGDRVH